MSLIDDLISVIEDFATAGPFRAYSQSRGPRDPVGVTDIRNDPVFGPVVEAIERVADRSIASLSNDDVRQVIQQSRAVQNRLTEARERAEQETSTMAVTYSDWVGIAFDVAKAKGASFETTQSEIRRGEAPSTEAISTFAEIWRDRKVEISRSRSAAKAVAEEEISVR